MSNLIKHARYELEAAGLFDKDSDYNGMIGDAVMRLVETHSKEGHSGMSHAITLDVFNRVINFKTLTSITAHSDEWGEVTDNLFQSKRDPSLFTKDFSYYWSVDEPEKKISFDQKG